MARGGQQVQPARVAGQDVPGIERPRPAAVRSAAGRALIQIFALYRHNGTVTGIQIYIAVRYLAVTEEA
jgi:hypothetical protein